MALIVLYDACVLYPASLRDLLMRLALSDLFQARWTDEIHDEWTRNVVADRPEITPACLTRCRRLMDLHVPDCLITGYESLGRIEESPQIRGRILGDSRTVSAS